MTMSRSSEHDTDKGIPTVFVVDDDEGIRRALDFLLSSAGYQVQCFDSAQAFLAHYASDMHGCLLLDVRMPGMDGLDLHEHLKANNINIPVVFVTAYADVPMAVRAMKAGAFDFVEKPFDGAELLNRVRRAISQDRRTQVDQSQLRAAQERLTRLTPREREVMELVVSGYLNKQIASELDISMKTVENHRAKVMEKMHAESLADLVRMAISLDSP
jgi:two-component system response regulator TtrR